jgi:hypothetical protein
MIGADLALPVDHLDDHASYIAMRLKPPRRAFFVHLDEISLYRSFERMQIMTTAALARAGARGAPGTEPCRGQVSFL